MTKKLPNPTITARALGLKKVRPSFRNARKVVSLPETKGSNILQAILPLSSNAAEIYVGRRDAATGRPCATTNRIGALRVAGGYTLGAGRGSRSLTGTIQTRGRQGN